MTALPEVPAGMVLRLSPGEWRTAPGELPALARLDVAVARTYSAPGDPTSVWVTGHAPECAYDTSDCVAPCVEVLVLVSAIVRQVSS